MRSEEVAKICSNCNTFKSIGYECPYINNFSVSYRAIKKLAEEHPDEFSTVSLDIGCVGFCDSQKKPFI